MSAINLANFQSIINKTESGYCLLAKLINYNELNAILGAKNNNIINDLDNIINKICSEIKIGIEYKEIEYNKIIMTIPKIDKVLLEELTYSIYSTTQLYTDSSLPEAYINCRIATIDFPGSANKAEEIYSLLSGMLTSLQPHRYHYQYSNEFYNLTKIKQVSRQLNLVRKALVQKNMKFDYQPIIDRKNANISYYECLLRIPDENNNFISVGPIIQDIEDKGLVYIVDHIVLEMAIKELVREPEINLSVNISNFGILDDYLLSVAEDLLKKYNLFGRLIIEITETSLNENYDKTKVFMDRLHKCGCLFALDDFGAGFTSLKQLYNLPIDIIKIDGSFVRDILSNDVSQYFVKTLIKISERLGIKTVAEFVENGQIAKFLIDIKIDSMQGNFFAPASDNRIIKNN
jgi:EAL domain-containing protein (putative c-di-GMP-specific phosphodiesterase class I)